MPICPDCNGEDYHVEMLVGQYTDNPMGRLALYEPVPCAVCRGTGKVTNKRIVKYKTDIRKGAEHE